MNKVHTDSCNLVMAWENVRKTGRAHRQLMISRENYINDMFMSVPNFLPQILIAAELSFCLTAKAGQIIMAISDLSFSLSNFPFYYCQQYAALKGIVP